MGIFLERHIHLRPYGFFFNNPNQMKTTAKINKHSLYFDAIDKTEMKRMP